MHHLLDGSNVHGRWEGVIARLAHVDVVIWVNRLLRAKFTASHLNGTVGDDLVDVHVRLSSRTGLPDAEGEFGWVEPISHFSGGSNDEVSLFWGQLAEVAVHFGRGKLQDAEGSDE